MEEILATSQKVDLLPIESPVHPHTVFEMRIVLQGQMKAMTHSLAATPKVRAAHSLCKPIGCADIEVPVPGKYNRLNAHPLLNCCLDHLTN